MFRQAKMNESVANSDFNIQRSYLIYTFKTSLRNASVRFYPREPDYQATISFGWGNTTR